VIQFVPGPSPSPDVSEPAPSPSPSDLAPASLPSLDDMIAEGDPAAVVIAQEHGPADGPPVPPAFVELGAEAVSLGELRDSNQFEVVFACLGPATIGVDLGDHLGDRFVSVTREACNGAVHRETVRANGQDEINLRFTDQASWRVVVRRLDGIAQPAPAEPPLLEVAEGDEELVARVDETFTPTTPDIEEGGLLLREIDSVPARAAYRLQVRCEGGDAVRYIHGDFIESVFTPTTSTHVDCDGRIHDIALAIPEPNGSLVYVAAGPETHWSVLVTSATPPIELVAELPGWQLSMGAGPELSFTTVNGNAVSFGGAGPDVDGGGQVLIAFACAGTGSGSVEVSVDIGAVEGQHVETFVADCPPEGAITSQSFVAEGPVIGASYPTPLGTWTALSVLIPEQPPAP
jgi:hypothetical protein